MNVFKRMRALARTMQKGEWQLFGTLNTLRTVRDDHCPLSFTATAATGHRYWSTGGCAIQAGKELGFDLTDSVAIMQAADCDLGLGKTGSRIRSILLRGAGLKTS